MTATEKPVDASTPPTLKKDWRFYAGITAMVLAVVMPLCALVVPMLGLSTTQSALLAGVLLAGGPEVLCILAVALLGKDTFRYFTHRVMTALRRAVIDQPASKARYYTGLVVILLSWLPAYIYAYSPTLMPGGDARIYVLAAMDLAFVVSVFLMGGEFWEKVRRILRRPDLKSAPDRFHREIRALVSRFRRSYPFAACARTNVGTKETLAII